MDQVAYKGKILVQGVEEVRVLEMGQDADSQLCREESDARHGERAR
mgnify:CR=1 FL=1